MINKKIIIGALLLFIVASGIFYAVTNSVTSDENSHIAAGYINVYFNDYRFNIEHPPLIKQLSALPLLFMKLNFPYNIYKVSSGGGTDIVNIQIPFLFKIGNNLDRILFFSRLPNILLGLLLGFLIYLYSKKLNGVYAGLISLACFAFCPNFLGHTPLVTMDVAISCFYFITVYFLLRYFETKKDLFLFLTGIFLGLTLISKYSGLVLIPVIYVLAVAGVFFCSSKDKQFSSQLNKWLLILGIPIFILTVAYKGSFRMIFPALLIYVFSCLLYKKSSFKYKIQLTGKILLIVLTIGFLFVILDYTDYKWFPLHSPTMAYFKGLAYFIGHAEGGHTAYLLGHYSDKGWWYYFPIAMFLKTPLAAIILVILGAIGLWLKKENNLNKIFLIIPGLLYFFVACFINKVNIGVRHVLPVFPFLYVIAGYAVNIGHSDFKRNLSRKLIFLLLAILAFDSLGSYPCHLSYFNRMVGGVKNGYKFLGDSNIAWGQDYKRLKKYIADNKIKEIKIATIFGDNLLFDYYKIPHKQFRDIDEIGPASGYYVIETPILQKKSIKWASVFKPIGWIGGSLLVYKITDNK